MTTQMSYQIGDTLPEIVTPAIDRMRIAYMTVSMRDPNLVHLEDDYAAKAGLPSVIAHGTFAVSHLGAAVSRAVGVDALTQFRVDLVAPVFPGDVLRTEATVTGVETGDGGTVVSVKLSATKADGTRVARGTAAFREPAAA
ncbi:MaoC family dehydratase [Prauserella flavalba]|nr:MaoC/PaaZ C-terminal domain-containing protein [Prauserella flavalba]